MGDVKENETVLTSYNRTSHVYKLYQDTHTMLDCDDFFNIALTKKTTVHLVSSEEEQENLSLVSLAVVRLKTFKPEKAISHEEMLKKFCK